MSEEKRKRIKRAIQNRRRPHPRTGRKTKILDDKALEELAALEHVVRVSPIVLERYKVECEDKETSSVLSCGVAPDSDRYAKRLLAGSMFSGPDAMEVMVHEHLLYTWKIYSDEDQAKWVGKEITITPRQGGGGLMDILRASTGAQGIPFDVNSLLGGMELTDEERKVLQSLVIKFMTRRGSGNGEGEAKAVTQRLKIVGVLRDFDPADGSFNILEDGNSMMADLFLPMGLARSLFHQSPFNLDQGYTRAIVSTDSSENAQPVQKEIQKMGFIAVSVGAILDRVDAVLIALTIFQTFLTGIIMIVAGLGIMTTMITSVVERTREIVIWKAVGASNNQVLAVFLSEAAIVGLIGSGIGLGLARILMFPGNILGRSVISTEAAMPFSGDVLVLPLWLLITAPLFATLIAVLAATYPALRGARIDPVKALRHD